MSKQFERLADPRHIKPGALDLAGSARDIAVCLVIVISTEKPLKRGYYSQWLSSIGISGSVTNDPNAIIVPLRDILADPYGVVNEVPAHQLGMWKFAWVPK